MMTTLLFAALAGAAQAQMTAADLPQAKGPVPEHQKGSAVQLWKMGLGFFSDGDQDRARALWYSCGLLDPTNEDCRKSLQGLDRAHAPKAAPLQAQAPAPAPVLPEAPAAAPQAKPARPAADASAKKAALLIARAASEENRQSSVRHWNEGVGFFQKGDLMKARDAWALCSILDAKNEDCLSGLKKIEASAKLAAAGPNDSQTAKQVAIRHWNVGISYFQAGDLTKAREEWKECQKADPLNLDCQTGVARVDQAYAGVQ
jgi:hypothetical protein